MFYFVLILSECLYEIGMFLNEWSDAISTIALIGLAVGSIWTGIHVYKQFQTNNKLTNITSKKMSADLSLKLYKKSEIKLFQEVFDMIADTSKDLDEEVVVKILKNEYEFKEQASKKLKYNIVRLLVHYETMAILWLDGLLTNNHVYHHHGRDLQDILYNKNTMMVFTEKRKEDYDFNFVNLHKLFEEIHKTMPKRE